MKYAGKIDLVPMKLTMQDLRCEVFLVFSGSQYRPSAMCKQLKKLGYTCHKDEHEQLLNCMKECKDNPGYTMSLSNLETIVIINPSKFSEQTVTELLGTIVHELSHAVTMLLNDVGCPDDDELRSIELENILVQTMHNLKLDKLLA